MGLTGGMTKRSYIWNLLERRRGDDRVYGRRLHSDIRTGEGGATVVVGKGERGCYVSERRCDGDYDHVYSLVVKVTVTGLLRETGRAE